MRRVDEIRRQAAYLAGATKWAAEFVVRGPSWVPVTLRRLPIKACAALVRFHVVVKAARHG